MTFKPESRPRRTLRKLLIKIKEKLNNYERVKNLILIFFKLFPKVKERLSRVGKTDLASFTDTNNQLFQPEELSPRAKKIYNQLKDAIDKKRRV